MARSIDEIKEEMQRQFMANDALMERYDIEPDEPFDAHFSRLSIERLLIYIVAAAIWAHERIFDAHQAEVQELIARQKPHTLRWYVEKAKAFRYGQALVPGTDGYDDTGLTPAEIEAMQVVKAASASVDGHTMLLKVAGNDRNYLAPLPQQQYDALVAYMGEVKDAGLRIEVVSLPGDVVELRFTILYDPQVLDAQGNSIETGEAVVLSAIKRCVEDIPFDSVLSRMALVDAVQAVSGVRVAELHTCRTRSSTGSWTLCSVLAIPYSGYFEYNPNRIDITYTPYHEYLNSN